MVAIGLLSACGQAKLPSTGSISPAASTPSAASPARQQSPSPGVSVSPSASASPLPALPPVARAQFPNCRLPYLKGSVADSHLAGGFVQGSQGLWTADPKGGISKSGDFFITDTQPTLKGSAFSSDDTGAYDLALGRWLPVRRTQVRSDGLAYAYAEPFKAQASDSLSHATRVHDVSLADGSDRVIYSGAPRVVVAYESGGVYVTAVRYYSSEGGSGLWRLDEATGVSTEIPNVQKGWIEAVDKGIAWTDGATIMPRALTRLDLSSGSQQTWASVGDQGWIWFAGLDTRGSPLVDLIPIPATTSGVLFVYTTSTERTLIANVGFHEVGVTDSHGTWLAGDDGIYLLDANDKLTKVSDVTGGTVSGGCH